MAIVGGIGVAIRADTRGFSNGLKKAKLEANAFSGQMKAVSLKARQMETILSEASASTGKLRNSFSTLKAVIGATLVTGFARGTKAIIDDIDAQDKWAERLGTTQSALAGLELANKLAGNSAATLTMGLQRMVRRIDEAARGTGEAQGALKTLGLEAETLQLLSPEQQFRVIADALEKVDTQGRRVGLAFKLFDSEGVALVNTMRGGSEALDEFQERAEKMGLALDKNAIMKFQDTKKAMDLAVETLKGFGRQAVLSVFNAGEMFGKLNFAIDGLGKTDEKVRAAMEKRAQENLKRLEEERKAVEKVSKAELDRFANLDQKEAEKIAKEGIARRASEAETKKIAESLGMKPEELLEKENQQKQESKFRSRLSSLGLDENAIKAALAKLGFGKEEVQEEARKRFTSPEEFRKRREERDLAFRQFEKGRTKRALEEAGADATRFGQVTAATVSIGGIQARKGQMVTDPQLKESNSLLRRILENLETQEAVFA